MLLKCKDVVEIGRKDQRNIEVFIRSKYSVTKTLEALRIASFADPYRSTLELLLFVGNIDGHDLKNSYSTCRVPLGIPGGNGRCLAGATLRLNKSRY
jgi:hypothetical protein